MFGKKKETQAIGGYLIEGLPVPANCFVQVIISPHVLTLTAVISGPKTTEQKFELELDKIKKIQILNETEIKQVVEQSAPGMIIGAAAFGAVGALVGGRVKTKEKTVLKSILLIDYVSGTEKQIVLNCSSSAPSEQEKFLERFYEIKPETNVPVGTVQL